MNAPQATLYLERVAGLGSVAARRMVGRAGYLTFYPLAGFLVGVALGELVAREVPVAFWWDGRLVSSWYSVEMARLVLAMLGWAKGQRLAHQRYSREFLAGIRERGTPESVTATYEISDQGLQMTTERGQWTIAWPAVLEISPGRRTWFIHDDLSTIVLPHSAFASEEDQKTFIGEILARMLPEARDRSVEAVAYAASTDA